MQARSRLVSVLLRLVEIKVVCSDWLEIAVRTFSHLYIYSRTVRKGHYWDQKTMQERCMLTGGVCIWLGPRNVHLWEASVNGGSTVGQKM